MSLMIEEIDGVQRNLEQTVVERTKELRAREAELQAQNMRFDAALSNMSQGPRDVRLPTARLVICNQRFIRMYRFDPDDIRPGMHCCELIELRVANGTFSGDAGRAMSTICAPAQSRAGDDAVRRAGRRPHHLDRATADGRRRLGGDPRGHHRAAPGGDEDRPHGAPRCADRSAQPRAAARAA